MDDDPYQQALNQAVHSVKDGLSPTDYALIISVVVILFVLYLFISGSQISHALLLSGEISEKESTTLKYKNKSNGYSPLQPVELFTTLMTAGLFLTTGIIILISHLASNLISPGFLRTSAEIISITLLFIFAGKIIPLVYAVKYSFNFAMATTIPLNFIGKVFWPVNLLVVNSSSIFNGRFSSKTRNLPFGELSEALEQNEDRTMDEKKILQGIANFGSIEVKEIMTSRVDVVGINIKTGFKSLISQVVESGYSRIPVYRQDLDNIAGILYIKDLLPQLDKPDSFRWESLLRPPYYVPESKKINELLKEFQKGKIHMAVVVDEFGGTSGIVTLEDILEEIVGEITDESDDVQVNYVKIDESNYLFEAKIPLHEFLSIFELPDEVFDDIKGEAETLAGLILEIKNELPRKNETIQIKDFLFTVKSVDQRRIKQVQVTLKQETN